MILFILFGACLVDLPNASYYTLLVSPDYFSQMNNVTWLIISIMTVFGFLMPPIEWIFIKNAEEIDRENGIYSWMFSTSLNKINYVFGKFIANIIILLLLWLTVVLATAIIGIIKFPNELSLLASRLPNFLIFIPGIIAIAACALFFENFKYLRGTLGTVIGIAGYFIIYASTTFKSSIWSFLNFSNSQMLIRLIRTDARNYGIKNANISVLGTSAHSTFEKHNLFFSSLSLTTQDLSVFALQLILAVVLLVIVYFTLRDYSLKTPQTAIENQQKLVNSSSTPIIDTNYQKKPHILTMVLNELKRICYETTLLSKGLLLLIWIIAWIVPAETSMEVLAFAFLLMLKYYDHLGTTIINTGIYKFIRSISNARNRQFICEALAAFIFTIVILLPAIIKNQSFGIYLWFAVATVLLCEMLGRLTRSIRPVQLISVCYWFIYLNGGNLFSSQIYYVVLALICVVILFLKNKFHIKA